MMIKPPFLVYDPECVLCTRFKQSFQRVMPENGFSFVPLNEAKLYEQYNFLNVEECQQTLHLVDSDLNVHKGPEALEYLIKYHPLSSPFLWLIESESGKRAVSFFYEKTNQLREAIKRSCPGCP